MVNFSYGCRKSRISLATLVLVLSQLALSSCGGGSGDGSIGSPSAPIDLNYTSPAVLIFGEAVTPFGPTVTGSVTAFSVAPALPAGLNLNPTTGTISGTPTTATATASYTISATNSGGSTTFVLRLSTIALTASPGTPQSVALGSFVTLDGGGSSTSSGDSLKFNWSFGAMPASSEAVLASSSSVAPVFRADRLGTFEIELVVQDGNLKSRPARVAIEVMPRIPRIIEPPAPGSVPITACREIAAPGNYMLQTDLEPPAGLVSGSTPCLLIRDASDVVLHCDRHRVSDSPDRAIRAIAVRNAPRFRIVDCEIVSDGVQIDDSPNGHIRDSRFRRLPGIANQPLALVRRASGMRFEYNDVADVAWSFLFSDDVIVADNRFHVTPGELAVIPYHVCFFYGRNDQVLRNEFSGGWNGTTLFPQLTNEVDDAVVLKDTVDARVEHNFMEDYWDAGIEWVGNLDSGHIASNVIVNAGIAAIGGWYWSSVANTRFEKNVGVRATTLFRATRDYGLRPAGYDGPPLPADTAVRFRDNVFDANVLRGPVSLNIYGAASTDAAVITVFSRMSYTGDLSTLPGERVPTDSEFELTNNVFRHNDFGRLHSVPQFGFSAPVPGVIVDGGQNVCAEPPADYPLSCG